MISEEVLRSRVEDYLRKSNALSEVWGRPITAAQLQAEMERMARSTKSPEILTELFAALGDDPTLIAETLVRPRLVERLARNAYALDEPDEITTATVSWSKKPFDSWWSEERKGHGVALAEGIGIHRAVRPQGAPVGRFYYYLVTRIGCGESALAASRD